MILPGKSSDIMNTSTVYYYSTSTVYYYSTLGKYNFIMCLRVDEVYSHIGVSVVS